MTAIVNIFICSYLFVALLWHLPGWTLWWIAIDPLSPLIRWLGFEQDWGMFAPDPPTSDRDLEVFLKLPSGGALVWEPPRMQALSRWGAFLKFRHRSYEHAVLYDEGPAACRAALAEYLLLNYHFGDESPLEVLFAYLDRPVAHPGQSAPLAGPVRKVFYTYTPSRGAQ